MELHFCFAVPSFCRDSGRDHFLELLEKSNHQRNHFISQPEASLIHYLNKKSRRVQLQGGDILLLCCMEENLTVRCLLCNLTSPDTRTMAENFVEDNTKICCCLSHTRDVSSF
jgi:hypothetical protein